jgi:hypothetical protein
MRYYASENEINEMADDCNTSREIIEAICEYRATRKSRDRVWADPSPAEDKKIIARAWQIVDRDNTEITELFWGGCSPAITR